MKRDESVGLLLALAGFALLSVGDGVVKTMVGQWPAPAIAAMRYLLGALGLAGLLAWREGPRAFVPPGVKVQFLRGLAVSMATIGFFSALFVMPITEATAISFTSPILTAVLAAVLLGEAARRETWLATLMAFGGVLIVLRPNFMVLGWQALLPLMSALGMSILVISNRAIAGKASALAMQAYLAIAATPILWLAASSLHMAGIDTFQLSWPSWSVLARCAVVACSASLAHGLIYQGTMRAGAATVAPMVYVQLLVVGLIGWLWFDEHPDATALFGAAIIIASGIYLWHSQRRGGRGV